MAKKSSPDLGDILLYGALGVGGIAIVSSLFKSSGSPAPTSGVATPIESAEKIATISTGAPYDISSALVPGYFNIVEFAADWCGACKSLKPQLEQLVQSRNDVLVRLVSVTDQNSPAAAQAVKEFHLDSIPYLRIYGPSGEFRGEVFGPNMNEIQALI